MACSKHASASPCCRAAASAIPFRIHSSAFIAQNHRPRPPPAQYAPAAPAHCFEEKMRLFNCATLRAFAQVDEAISSNFPIVVHVLAPEFHPVEKFATVFNMGIVFAAGNTIAMSTVCSAVSERSKNVG